MVAQSGGSLTHDDAERILRVYTEGFATRDVEAQLALFAEDATFEDPAGTLRGSSKDALRTFLNALPTDWSLVFTLQRVALVGNEAIATYNVVLTAGANTPSRLLVNSHVVFNDAGLITSLRTFFDEHAISEVFD